MYPFFFLVLFNYNKFINNQIILIIQSEFIIIKNFVFHC